MKRKRLLQRLPSNALSPLHHTGRMGPMVWPTHDKGCTVAPSLAVVAGRTSSVIMFTCRVGLEDGDVAEVAEVTTQSLPLCGQQPASQSGIHVQH